MDNLFPLCENCIYANNPIEQDPCNECYKAFLAWSIKPNFKNKPKTNADRIRAMTDKELAEFLAEERTAPSCTAKCHKDYEIYGELRTFCSDCWFEWLKQEVTE